MVYKKIVFACILHFCCGWKIKASERNQVQGLKTTCILMCPFQKQTSDLYIDDIQCEIDCKIEHCVKGCHFLEAALETDCRDLCNVSNNVVNSSHLFCFIGCEQSLMAYFDSVRSEISHLKAPSLLEHTLSNTSLTLEWMEPNLINESYLLQCCNVDVSNAWQFCQNQTWISSNSVLVQNLQPYTKYQFRVAIRLTPGDWYEIYSASSTIIATSPGGLPTSPPHIQTATAVSSSIISVIWVEGQFTNGPILSYILQVNEQPMGYAGVKDILATKKSHSCMLKNLLPSTTYSIAISARNAAGLGPRATVTVTTKPFVDKTKDNIDLMVATGEFYFLISDKTKDNIDLMVATDHSVYSVSSDIHEEPVLVYNTTHIIKGIALHVHRELLFISDSSGSIIVTSSKGLLTPQELPVPPSSKPSALTIDWLSDYLYILSEILHPSGSVVYEVARCALDGSNLIVVISGFIVKPHHIEVDPYNGYLFWVVRGVGLYRLDLIDISKTINRNVSPEVILEDSNLGGFLVNGDSFRIIISVCSQSTINAISLDGQEIEPFCEKNQDPKFQNVISLALTSGSLFWTNGERMYQEVCDSHNKSILQNITDKLFMENSKAVVANAFSSQTFPVPVNPPTNFQAIFGHDIAKVSWDKPYRLAGQGDGAWSAWSYRLVVESKSGVRLFDFSDIKANQYTVSSLKPGTDYVLKVAAYTFTGEGPWSKEFRGKTLHRNASLLWSNNEGLLLSDVTGYRVTKIEPINYLEADSHFQISDIDWYEDQVFVSTNKQQVFWYNLTSNTYGRIQDVNGANCISVEWLAKKLYWGNTKNKMIFRSNFNGNEQEILPIIVAAESLFLDTYDAYLYWSTKNTVEGACLDGTKRRTFYESKNPFVSQIVGLALDIDGSELYWIEKTSVQPRQSALMIINVKRYNRDYNTDFLIDKFTLINQDVEGGICYIDQHLVWVRNDDKNAMISGLNGTTTALIHSDSLSNLVTCTAVDPFVRTIPLYQGNSSEKVNVIPNPVQKSSIRIEGSYDSFNVLWDPVTNVNYGKIFYRVKMRIDDVDSIIETPDSSIAVRNRKAYVPVKIIVQSCTYWAASNAVRVTLRSPSSTPSAPMNPRIFITHKKKSMAQQKDVSDVLFRWSPPAEPNGVVRHYELSCWVTNNHTNLSGTTCSSSQISARTLEFTLQNLPSNKMHNFQVRACTDYGCGNWSEVVRTNFEDEISIPKLFLTTKDGLIKLDYDRKSFIIANVETKNARDIFYDAGCSTIYWIERNCLYQSDLNLHLSNIKKLIELQAEGNALSYDWIARNLYWVEVNKHVSSINTLDLNRNEEDRRKNTLFERQAVVRNVVASPMNSALFWVELEKPEHVFGTLMKCHMDGTNIKEFFSKDVSFAKNDISSLEPHASEEHDAFCSWNRSSVGPSISIYPSSGDQYRLLWYDISSGFVASSDLEGYNCKRIVEVRSASMNSLPQSITADFKRVYWLDSDETTVYSASIDEPSTIETVTANSAIRLQRILAYGTQLQILPDVRCLRPHLKPGTVKVVKFSSDSIVFELPQINSELECGNVSMATVEYTVYFGTINDDGTSNCTLNLKSCSQVVTYDSIKKISKLKPYTRYVFMVGIGNYYSLLEGIDPVLGGPAIYRTAPGIPSPPRNVTVVPITPNAIFVKWLPPEHLNAEAVGYSVHWSPPDPNDAESREQSTFKLVNSSILLSKLTPDQEYVIWVEAFPIVNNRPATSIGYKCSENITVRTYPEPSNLTVANVTSQSLNLSLSEGLDKFRFDFELYDPAFKTWNATARDSDQFVVLRGLHPLTAYKVRLKIWYAGGTFFPFVWIPDGFEFRTLGDKPTPPGVPTLKHVDDDLYQASWEPSHNYGLKALTYWLDGRSVDMEYQADEAEYSSRYSNWTIYYNGTDVQWLTTTLKRSTRYQFRVRSENEHGFGEYSNASEEYYVGDDKYAKIAMWSILPFCVIGGSVFVAFIYVCYRKPAINKPEKCEKDEILTVNKNDLELVSLQEIPAGTNFVNNTLLYTPQTEECPAADELSHIPRIRREQITLTTFLGSGAFGEVYEGQVRNLLYVNIDTKVAIKALRRNATEQEKVEFLKEASLMSNFKHQHILQLLGVCIDNNPHFIIMELMEGGDLLSYLRSNRSSSVTSSTLTYQDLLRICCDVASGCCYLEELHFVHRDLACRNCLVSSKDPARRVVKIGDFGLARDIYKNDYYRKEGEGLLPVRWMAPESLVDGVFTRHSDVWSFGVLLWEVMSLGQQPYQARSNVEVLQYVRSGGRLSRPANCPLKLSELMQKCWCNQPKERPTFVYCLFELEKLKNDCNNESVTAYTMCLPVSDST